ncbi:uncharacterized protein MONBRDRAFT_5489 [Monosiga brevicollis MX1]|uniref:Fibronectin type-III domain-containing protein n=1 Tax=Monosiga brevicollis TaxID=81824 RepID=A9UNK6_MONBE|nr:uncharacterized protein MONBRDRAFT_5489 [Monosiga brevicollis MX1]EDQ93154.1 predicted protein [Monosiga brevicollis MX1]|eukprot:XP_001742916.1 hypothetical protein [Monosiga brevicollis MX1]
MAPKHGPGVMLAALFSLAALLAPAAALGSAGALSASSICNSSSCVLSWVEVTDATVYQIINESNATVCETADNLCDVANALITLAACAPYQFRLKATGATPEEVSIGPVFEPAVVATSAPPAATITELISNSVVTVTFSADTTHHFVDMFNVTFTKSGDVTDVTVVTVEPQFPADQGQISKTITIDTLASSQTYSVRVLSISCHAQIGTSSASSITTSRNVIVPDVDNTDRRTRYLVFNLLLIGVAADDFDANELFVAIGSALRQHYDMNAADVSTYGTSLSYHRLGPMQISRLPVIDTTPNLLFIMLRNSLLSILQEAFEAIATPTTCDNILREELKVIRFSVYNSDTCITLQGNVTASSTDATYTEPEPTTTSKSDWRPIAIIVGASVGGAILLGLAIYLFVVLRRSCYENKVRSESRVDLGVELRQASLY